MSFDILGYSPEFKILIETDRFNQKPVVYDITKDVVSGSVTLNEDAPHVLNFLLTNSQNKYVSTFLPRDRVILFLKKFIWIQRFTGYINESPRDRAVRGEPLSIEADCTLDNLNITFWDSGLEEHFYATKYQMPDAALAYLLIKVGGWRSKDVVIDSMHPFLKAMYSDPRLNQLVGGLQSQAMSDAPIMFGSEVKLPKGFESARLYMSYFQLAAQAYHGFAEALLWLIAICKVESNFNPYAGSGKGATGLMQIMPLHWKDKDPYDLRANPFDPEKNINAGARILAKSAEGHSLEHKLVAYNAGGGYWKKWFKNGKNPKTLYEESRNYVKKVFQALNELKRANGMMPTEPSFDVGLVMSAEAVENPIGLDAFELKLKETKLKVAVLVTNSEILMANGKTKEKTLQVKYGEALKAALERKNEGHTVKLLYPRVSSSGKAIMKDLVDQANAGGFNAVLSFLFTSKGRRVGNNTEPKPDEIYVLYEPDKVDLTFEKNLTFGAVGLAKATHRAESPSILWDCKVKNKAMMLYGEAADYQDEYDRVAGDAFISLSSVFLGDSLWFGVAGVAPEMRKRMSAVIGIQRDEMSMKLETLGEYKYLNDKPLLPDVKRIAALGMYHFCTDGFGRFVAWQLKDFGPVDFIINDLELENAQTTISDDNLVTHSGYVSDVFMNDGASWNDLLTLQSYKRGISLIDEPRSEQFDEDGKKIVYQNFFSKALRMATGKEPSDADVEALRQWFFKRYGIRPSIQGLGGTGVLTDSSLVFTVAQAQAMSLYHLINQWSLMYKGTVDITFMPELVPGMRIGIPKINYSYYVSSVTHHFGDRYDTSVAVKGGVPLDKVPKKADPDSNPFGLGLPDMSIMGL